MDEPAPSQRRDRHRHRGLAGAILATLLTAAATALSQAAPARTTTPSPALAAPTVLSKPTVLGEKILEAQPGLWRVVRDVDGDTIEVQQESRHETIRLLGIDTPETHDPRKPVQCFGLAAAAHTRSLVEGHNVRLEPDPQDSDRDKYHRLLRYVYLPDGTLLNAKLVRDGYAFAYTVFPLTRLDEFRTLEQQARAAGRGLWSACNIDESQTIKQTTSTR